MAKNFTKVLCAFLAFVMCLGTVPAFAIETTETFIPQPPEKVGNNYPISKKLNNFENDIANITLSVPADDISLGVDIIYVLGAFASTNGVPNVEGDIIISCLTETMSIIVGAGIPVNFGVVGFTGDDKPLYNLTPLTTAEDLEKLPDMIADAIVKADFYYDQVNMENALIKAKKMFSESKLANYPDRQHLVMISSGQTYFFNSGDNNEYISTVPVRHNTNYLFFENKAWQRARLNQTNTYAIPEGITKEYNANPDKYDSLWDCYWSFIDSWVKADIAAGDKLVYEACTAASGEFQNWKKSAVNVSGYSNTGYGKTIVGATAEDIANTPSFAPGANPVTNASAAHAIGNERAMWEAYEFSKDNFIDAGINFYPIYHALKPQYSNGIWSDGRINENGNAYAYNVSWTNQYIGHSFMNMLAGGEAIVYENEENKAFFDPIKEKILYSISTGSKVTDAIGYDATEGNFDFVTNVDTIKLAVNGVEYTTTMIASTTDTNGKIITASYDFLDAEGARKFSLDYYYGDGKEGEYFDWNFYTDVSMTNRVSLTYDLKLVEKSSEIGEHFVNTNRFAALYPVDSDGKAGIPHLFPVPEVEYEVNPYDVDIVLALGAGIAQYDADNAKGYTHTYDSIVSLVEPLVMQGINVKLGLIAVEHYDDVAMELTVLTKDNYKTVITDGLNAIQQMPAGPTNLHGNIEAAKAMLDADKTVPAANKFFYVFATGRTYNYDNADGVPTTIINKLSFKGNTYYYWGHYLWQSQRGGHTSLYMIPAKYNNDFSAYWADVEKWVAADGDTYAYSFTEAYDPSNPQWFNTFYAANSNDAKSIGASSRFGWILDKLTNSGLDAIGSGSNPKNALNYERAQYEAYQTYQAMIKAGYNCEAICTETPNYQNGSEYIKNGAKYTGTSTIQLGHSFMNFLNGGEAKVLFDYTRDENGNFVSAATVFAITDYFEGMSIDTTKLVKSTTKALEFNGITYDIKVSYGTVAYITVEAEGDVTYEWHVKTSGGEEYVSTIDTETYKVVMDSTYDKQEVYCIITDELGNKKTTDTVTFILSH